MKQFYFLIIGLFFLSGLNAQIINFLDANFKAKLLQANPTNLIAKNLSGDYFKIDANGDGEIEVNEALEVSFLNVSFSDINSVDPIDDFVNLKFLSCNNNNISSINTQNLVNVEYLLCSNNNLVAIDISSLVNLKYFECNSNQISNLNLNNNTSMTYLACSGNLLTSLDASELINLKELYCQNNSISSLNVLGLSNLLQLSCFNNLLTDLDVSGLHLTSLICSSNQLSSLNLQGMNLGSLYCGDNLFTSFDFSQMPSLGTLDCRNNQITQLNLEGCNIGNLNCSNNLITTLNLTGMLQPTCMEGCQANLTVSNNNLTSIFVKSAREDVNLIFNGNPNLEYICTNDALIQLFQNRATAYGYTNCVVNSYCSFTPGGTFYSIEGMSRYDFNNDGCNQSDFIIPNLNYAITNGLVSGNLFANQTGNYFIPVQAGSLIVTPFIENSSYFTVSPTNVTVNFPINVSPFNQNFCITPNGVHADLEVLILPVGSARPGFDVSYKIIIKNKGNQTQSGSVNLTYQDAILDFVTANPGILLQTPNTLIFDFDELQPFATKEMMVTFNLNSPDETPAVNGGDILTYTVTLTAVPDETPADNTFELHQTVINSFDPNDKTCLEGNTITPEMVGKEVHYLIRFENTGTANAENIVVKDMIDTTKFDINSLIPIDGSHPFVTKISNTNKVEFIFENINLPFDDANNDGYVAFKIKTKPTLVVGNSFSNTASIYFDYNFPIITNTATTTVALLANVDFAFEDYFKIYPNPANDILNIDTKQTIEVTSINIYNALGQIVLVIPNAQQTKSVDVSGLKTGNYFVKINSDKVSSSVKFVKM